LDRLDPTTGTFQHILFDPTRHPLSVHALIEDRHGVIWIGTDHA
jgi:ligand-binding sensor domain-containing protein